MGRRPPARPRGFSLVLKWQFMNCVRCGGGRGHGRRALTQTRGRVKEGMKGQQGGEGNDTF